ncbi:MAG TPA: 2-dehydropantoate 2-reductase, partial [Candidatus Deferrimicrobiaceae bacterium]
MNIGVIGSGAVGLFYGARLQKGGHDVRFLLRKDYGAIVSSGLAVNSIDGDFRLDRVKGFLDSADMGSVELVLVALKTFANERLIDLVRPLMTGDAAVLTLQNGLGNEDVLAEAFGAERVLGGVAMIGVGRTAPGVVRHTALGAIRLGDFRNVLSERAQRIAAMFRDVGIKCEAVADLRKIRWEKLVWNIPFNGLCTVTGRTPGALLALPSTRRLVQEIMEEVVMGGNAQGLAEAIPDDFVERMIATTEKHTGGHRPSMMIDRIENRPLELDAIYGIPLDRASRMGVEMTRVRMLRALLEAGERSAP